jgi:hypothetical protein
MKLRILNAIVLAAACDGDAKSTQKSAADDAAQKQAEADDKAAADRKAKREAEAKAEADAKAARETALDGLAALPPELPKKQDQACKAMLTAYDKYMSSVLTGDLKTKWDTGGNEMQLKLFGAECKKRSFEVAACQTNALGKMGPEHEKDMSDIFMRCVQKFG